jgi:hypothetical protein
LVLAEVLIQSQLDETSFLQSGDFDPIIDGTVVQKDSYFNVDIGASYNYLDFYAFGTVKMLSNQKRYLYRYESDNLRKYLLSVGYLRFEIGRIFEPSVLFQLVEKTQEKSIDINMKYIKYGFGTLWEACLIEEVSMELNILMVMVSQKLLYTPMLV